MPNDRNKKIENIEKTAELFNKIFNAEEVYYNGERKHSLVYIFVKICYSLVEAINKKSKLGVR
ncbi:hypothetical protein [Clostridium beijerinckii]|uniref:hypothetical protein n=1 Tax=Clostridium beijerinckii TaxID=1520 RepID=UPI00149483A8|nr:hypothetical protein [Clostridium beijerinckii]NOW04195.1 hypothetical protein [Clostridium beijerinckii]NRT71820.1 hypothetical protein [Clostridium beijerinckii]NYC02664.1 hypothetical protein [Clostridium beijerinckii]